MCIQNRLGVEYGGTDILHHLRQITGGGGGRKEVEWSRLELFQPTLVGMR